MTSDVDRVAVIGLVARFRRPTPASPRTRETVPGGYGTQEQCLPFVAAAGLGLTVPSPVAWGHCAPADVPPGARAFRSPIDGGCPDRVFYVVDDCEHDFERNQFRLSMEARQRVGPIAVPGLSFFDRTDQQDMVKLHLPYIWRTAEGADLLFAPPLNRSRADGLLLLAGVVECGWYANPVNLVMQLPLHPGAVHVAAGEPIAQAILLQHDLRKPRLEFPEPHRREARNLLEGMADWHARHDRDRSAYKRLARSRAGVAASD